MPSTRSRSVQAYLIFLLSGMAALVYQVIWARWLGLVFGNTTTSVSIILGAFMLGLALGSWLGGRRVGRVRNPMRAYALLELGIGAFAVSFPLLTAGLDALYSELVSPETALGARLALRAALAFALLLLPTALMGATLPLLAEFFRRAPQHDRRWRVGLLYAMNTFGAALGVVLASFVGIELVGIRATTLGAAGLNGLVALSGFALARSAAAPAESAAGAAPAPFLPPLARTVLAVLFASGALALASEVLWTRTLEILIGNSTYAFATLLVVYLVGIALGSFAFSLLVKGADRLELWMAGLLLGMAVWTLVALESFGVLHQAVASDSRRLLGAGALLWNYLRVALVLLPLSLLSGALFPVATRLLEPEAEDAGGELVARAYSWNTLGSLVGSLVGGFVLAPRLDYFQAIHVVGGLYAAAAAAVCLRTAAGAAAGRLAPASLLAAALVAGGWALAQARGESRFVTRLEELFPGWEVVFHRPGLQGVTTAIRRPGEREAASLLVNGQGMTVKATDTKMMAHVPMLAHPHPENTLVICFGMGTTYRSAITHGGRVTVVELVPEVLEAFDRFHADAARVRAYPKGRMVADDGRNFLKLTRERFDVITLDPPPPIDAAGVTNLYSREFVALARERLAPGGIFAHWIPFPGTKAGVESDASFHMLLATIVAEFPHVSLLPALDNGGMHVLASEAPIAFDPDRLAAALARPEIAADMREWQPVPAAFFERLGPWSTLGLAFGRGGRTVHRLAASEVAGAPLLTDDRPRLEFDLWDSVRSGRTKYYPSVWGR